MQLPKEYGINYNADGILVVLKKPGFEIVDLIFIKHKPEDAFIGRKCLLQLHLHAKVNYLHSKPERLIRELQVISDVS